MKKQAALGLCLLALTVVSAQEAQGAAAYIGSSITDRSLSDGAYQIAFVDTLNPVTFAGKVVSWHLYAESRDSVDMQVYRPTATGYRLVGENTVTPANLGVNEFNIPVAEQISVEAGDLLGFYYGLHTGGSRTISFNFASQEGAVGGVLYTAWPYPALDNLAIGDELAFNEFSTGGQETRTYSFGATVISEDLPAVPEPASLSVLALGTAALLVRRRR